MPKLPENLYLFHGLIDLANAGAGVVDVFESPDGEIITIPDPPPALQQALRSGDADMLQSIFRAHGFGQYASALLVSRLVKKGKGRPPLSTPERLYEQRLKQIKGELRASGKCDRLHQTAMEMLVEEHRLCQEWAAKQGLSVPDLDSVKLGNYLRRSKQPRAK